jgi:hypothetical protein
MNPRFTPLSRFTAFVLSLFMLACNPERIQQTPELKRQMADSKLKRITSADQMTTVNDWGTKIVNAVQRELTASLQTAKTPAQRTALCQLTGLPKTQAIIQKYAIDLSLLQTADVKNARLAPKEREVLDAYLYQAENKLPQEPNIQRIGDSLFVFNTAVPADNAICQTCFPDQKLPFAVWRLVFRKNELVRQMANTKLKKK